jgi:2-C-methyl-D-erythritol 4-phosphate cytidylyltransferase
LSGICAVVLAAGGGGRVAADSNKVYLGLMGRPLLSWSIATLAAQVDCVMVVVRPGEEAKAAEAAGAIPVEVVPGGATRFRSESAALEALADRIEGDQIDLVLMHDGARPVLTPQLIGQVIAAARRSGGAVPATPIPALLARRDNQLVPLDGELVGVQTPQGFSARPLLEAFRAAAVADVESTDTAATIERFSDLVVTTVPGDSDNIKVTWPADVERASRLLAARGT